MTDLKRVGLIVGREWSWPPAFIEAVNGREAGVVAELARLDITVQDQPVPYDVLIDRISHEIPFYRSYLKNAALQGTVVINNPFMWSADDKFFGASLLTELGIAHPRTVVLPNHDCPGLTAEDLTNLQFPLPWEAIVEYVGLPAILKDAHGGGWKEVYRIDSLGDLIARYNETGSITMILQEFITWDHYVRCLCIGQDRIMPIKYDPHARRYHVEHAHMSPELGRTVVEWAQRINRALGYDMNTVEFAVRDGVPYSIDFMNPAPDMDVYSLTPFYFDWVVEAMADLAIGRALAGGHRVEPRWDALLAGRLADAGGAG
jgi:hypothetical protein